MGRGGRARGGVGLVRGGQGGCERRIKVFVKIQKTKFFYFLFFFFWGGGGVRGVRWGGGRVGWVGGLGLMLTQCWGRGDVGYGGCEPRVEGIVQGTKRYCTILRKEKKCGGGEGGGAIFEPKTLSLYSKKKKKKGKKNLKKGIN